MNALDLRTWPVALLVMVSGGLLWLATDKPKLSELGRIAFFVGLFALVVPTS